MLKTRIQVGFLLLLFVYLHTAITLSWVQKTSIPMVLEEVREHAETEEDVSFSMDLCYTMEKNNEDFLRLPLKVMRLHTGYSNEWSGRAFIPDHYSPPEQAGS